jgi:hypothetical protein
MRRYATLLIVVAIALASCNHRSSKSDVNPRPESKSVRADPDSENVKIVDGVARYDVPYQVARRGTGGSSPTTVAPSR